MAFSLKENPFKDLPKPVIVGGIVVTVGVSGYVLIRRKQKTGNYFGSATGTATAAGAVDPVTGLPVSEDNSTDPLTGQPYLAEAQQYGSVQAAEAAVSSYGTGSGTGSEGAGPGTGAGGTTAGAGSVGSPAYTSNAAWAQAAQAGLSDISGGDSYDGTDIGTALGDYLESVPVTAAQASVINTALAEFGPPPVGSFQIIQKPVSPTGPSLIRVPRVDGLDVEEAQPLITQIGLKSVISPNTNPKGVTRTITSVTPAEGTEVNPGSTITLHWMNKAPHLVPIGKTDQKTT